MANALYGLYKEKCLLGNSAANRVDIGADTIKVALVTAGYVANMSTDEFWSTPVGSLVGTPQAIGSKTVALGVFNGGNVTFSAVSGSQVTQLVIYDDTPATNATKRLIARIDTATGLPVTPSGGDITVSWDTGANKIFAL